MIPQTFYVILTIAGTIISILLGLVGFWLARYVRSTDELTKVVTSLRIVVEIMGTSQKDFQASCAKHTELTERRLNIHSEKLEDHEKRITIMETGK